MMIFFTTSLISALIAVAITLASTVPRPMHLARSTLRIHSGSDSDGCFPNFFGAGIEITSYGNSALHMGVTSSAASGAIVGGSSFRGSGKPDWHVQQDGQDPMRCIVHCRDVDNNGLAVTFESDKLVLEVTCGLYSDQLFRIVCLSCYEQGKPGDVVADYCLISPTSTDVTQCVETSGSGPVVLESCEDLNEYQVFTFTSF